MSAPVALIVDDERDIRELIALTLNRMDIAADTAATLGEAKAKLASRRYDLCFTDMRLPDGSGQELIVHIAENHPDLPVAMITAYGNVEAAVAALKAGAFDFVSKPVDLAALRRMVETALKLSAERRAVANLAAERLQGESLAIRQVRETIAKLARSQAPVHITGESGTGKELAARLIHEQGPRAAGPFVPVNCGAIPPELMESEFFGHRKGSFTGAHSDKIGLFQAADGGTLFLDEIAELPVHMQVKLLRAIQERKVRPVGAQNEVPVDVRILSATHKDLAALVAQGVFRHDLYYRINVIELRMPALRERREDIPLLARHILARVAHQHGIATPELTGHAIVALQHYAFPGNVRELENILERAVALCDGKRITAEDLRLTYTAVPLAPPATGTPVRAPGEGSSIAFHPGEQPLEDYVERIEREAILKALEECRYNKTKAAAKLGITFRALRYRLKKLGIE
ncbi:MAG: sigma-54-dependent Fis family transcriptional regulator [Lysobacterales bacterium]|jgi:two-component system response regulator PilR (NtrC family)|nr:MAG: sigma-54-dependent Fis family transcriptional regulator [Xanthomonadales bacterium]